MSNLQYEKATKYVQALKNFYIHLIVYVTVNIGLIGINLVFSSDYKWFIYPLLGWGIGIVAHGLSVFSKGLFLGKDWEEKQIEKYMRK